MSAGHRLAIGGGRLERLAALPTWVGAVLVSGLGLLLTLHQLGDHPLVDFDEALDAVIAHHMVQSGNWLVPVFDASVRLRRPPLFFWLAGLAVVLTHHSTAFAYRLPSALGAAALAGSLVVALRRQFRWGLGAAVLAGVCLLTMPYFLLLSREALLSVLAAALASGAILAGRLATRGEGGWLAPLVAGVALGLLVLDYSAMVSLPLAVLIADALLRRRRPAWGWRRLGLAVGVALLLGLWWPVVMALHFGGELWAQYLVQNVFERLTSNVESGGRPFYYYPPLLAAGTGAWGPLVALAAVHSWRRMVREADSPERLAAIWVVLGVVGFSLSTTKLPWYMGPVYPGLALLVAAYLARLPTELGVRTAGGASRRRLTTLTPLALAGLTGVGLGLWPAARPFWALVACAGVGLVALGFELAGRGWGEAGATRAHGLLRPLAATAISALLLTALLRALILPLAPGTAGLAENLQPEPDASAEAAIARVTARDPAVPLGLLTSASPTLLFYSGRQEAKVYASVAAAAQGRRAWLIAAAPDLPALRREAPGSQVLARAPGLVLVALPGAPRLPPRAG